MILLDTTVLVYAVGDDHALRDRCRSVISAIGDGRLSAATTVEVIQEFAHIRARRRGRADAAALASQYATLLAPLVMIDTDDLTSGLRLFREHEHLGAFDAVLAAASLQRPHITGILSADRAFAEIPELTFIDPAGPDLAELLGL